MRYARLHHGLCYRTREEEYRGPSDPLPTLTSARCYSTHYTLRLFSAFDLAAASSLANDSVMTWPLTTITMLCPINNAFFADIASAYTTDTVGGRSCDRSVSNPPKLRKCRSTASSLSWLAAIEPSPSTSSVRES